MRILMHTLILLLRHGGTSPAGVTGSAGRVCIFQMHETDRSLSSGKHSLYWKMGLPRLQLPSVLEIRHDPEYIGPWIINKAAKIRCYQGSKVDVYCQESGFEVEYL